MNFYKVVRRLENGKLISAANNLSMALQHEYKLGEKTETHPDLYSRGLGLFVFTDLVRAENFRKGERAHEVYFAEVEDPKFCDMLWAFKSNIIDGSPAFAELLSLEELLKFYTKPVFSETDEIAICKSVTLIRKVEKDEIDQAFRSRYSIMD